MAKSIVDSLAESNAIGYRTLGVDLGYAQSFVGADAKLSSCSFYLSISGDGVPEGELTAKLYSKTAAIDDYSDGANFELLATSVPIPSTNVTTTPTLHTFNFTGVNQYQMEAGTPYAIALTLSVRSQYSIRIWNASGDPHLGVQYKKLSYWGAFSAFSDFIFYVYGTPGFELAVNDSISTSDNQSRITEMHRNIADSVSPQESISKKPTITATDSVSVYDEGLEVSGAGSTGYNGVYNYHSIFNDRPAYRLDDNHWLWWEGSVWFLSTSLEDYDPAYYCSSGDPVDFWGVYTGQAPGPTVTLININKSFTLNKTDSVNSIETLTKGANKTLTDIATNTDNVAKSSAKSVSDIVSESDSVSKSTGKNLSDTVIATDLFSKAISMIVQSAIAVTDLISSSIISSFIRKFTKTSFISKTNKITKSSLIEKTNPITKVQNDN